MDDFLKNFALSLLMQALVAAFAPKPKRTPITPNALKDFSFPTSSETRPIPDVVGTVRIEAPNTLWSGDFHTAEVTKKIRTGLFSTDKIALGTNYSLGFAMGLCHAGAGVRLKKVWVDDNLAWSGSLASGSTATVAISYGDGDLKSGLKGIIEFHSGDTTPSAYLERMLGVGNVPAYTHLTYVVFRGVDGGSMGSGFGASAPNGWVGTAGSLPKITYEVENIDILPAVWVPSADLAAYAARRNVAGDANPAYVLYRALIHPLIGAGLSPDDVLWSTFHAAALTFFNESNGWSHDWDSARSVDEYKSEIERQTNAFIVPDPTTGQLSLRPIRETEAIVLALSPSNVVGNPKLSRDSVESAANEITLAFTDRTNSYVDRTAAAPDLGAQVMAGQVNPQSVAFSGVSRPELAGQLTSREVRAATAQLARLEGATVITDIKTLRPGDPISYTWPPRGIANLRMRITSARYSDTPGQVEIDAVEDVFLSGTAVYSLGSVPSTGGGGSSTPPSSIAGRARLIQAPYGLAQTDYDRSMILLSPSNANQATFDVAYSEANSTVFSPAAAQWDTTGNYALMASGNVSGTFLENATTLAISCDAVNGALLKAMTVPTGGLLILVGTPAAFSSDGSQLFEWMRCSAFAVAANNLSASLTVSKRGMFDSHPKRATSTAEVWVIPRVVMDPSGLSTCVSPDVLNGPVLGTVTAGEQFSRPWAFFRSSAGVMATAGTMIGSTTDGLAQDGTSSRYGSRCSRPTNAGEPKLAGTAGAYARTDTLPTIANPGAAVLPVSWKNRNRKYATDPETVWATGTGVLLPSDIATRWTLQRWTGSSWNTLDFGVVSTGAETANAGSGFSLGLVSGDVVRVVVYHFGTSTGTPVWPPNVPPGTLSSDSSLARHYRIA